MKEIIIDGVNVAECYNLKQYNDTEGNMMCMEYIDGGCEGHNCYFKQLKRLEQENARLKEEKLKYYQQTLDDEIKLNELYQTLQKINEKCNWVRECGVTNDNMWEYYEIQDLIKEVLQ